MEVKSITKIVGLVGKANVGKSTFFGAATLKPVEIAGFPLISPPHACVKSWGSRMTRRTARA